jgi:hypothetical protein
MHQHQAAHTPDVAKQRSNIRESGGCLVLPPLFDRLLAHLLACCQMTFGIQLGTPTPRINPISSASWESPWRQKPLLRASGTWIRNLEPKQGREAAPFKFEISATG